MNIAPVTTRRISLTGASLTADKDHLFLESDGERLPLSGRASKEMSTLTGLTHKRMFEHATMGGIDLSLQMRGSNTTSLACGIQENAVIAVTSGVPLALEGAQILEYFGQQAYSLSGHDISDGRLVATKVTSQDVRIGSDPYRTGHAIDIDLAGHTPPTTHHYVLRQICANGQTLSLSQESRRVPQHDEDGAVYAHALAEHLSAWARQGIPDQLINRLQVAAETRASFSEVMGLFQIARSREIVGIRNSIASTPRQVETYADQAFDQMFGDYRARLGVGSLNEIPVRDLHYLPSETTVAGVINLATEMTSHFVPRHRGGTKLTTWWNHLMGGKYDLEGLSMTPVPLPARWMPLHHRAMVN